MELHQSQSSSDISKEWKQWEVRGLVMVSLCMQIILILFASARSRVYKWWLIFILWLVYFLADWVATYAIGTISDARLAGSESSLYAFWCPFLLLHLGGPDSITSFSLEDNELWQRHVVGMMAQSTFAIYVFGKYSPSNTTTVLLPAIFVLFTGLIKYTERSWALWQASMDSLRNSMVGKIGPSPSPIYNDFIGTYTSKYVAGIKTQVSVEYLPPVSGRGDLESQQISDQRILSYAYYYLEKFGRLVVDLMLTADDVAESKAFFLRLEYKDAFRVIEAELAFLYEMLHTKAPIIRSIAGLFVRVATLGLILASLLLFSLSLSQKKRDYYSPADKITTYILLVGGLSLELYAIWLQLSSDWFLATFRIRCHLNLFKNKQQQRSAKKWSNKMSKFNVMRLCLNNRPSKFNDLLTRIGLIETWHKYKFTEYEEVSEELKELILNELKRKVQQWEKSKGDDDNKQQRINKSKSRDDEDKHIGSYRGEWALNKDDNQQKHPLLLWSTVELEFDESVLIWHIATEICYESDNKQTQIGKDISEYMLYLLVYQSVMPAAGIGRIRFSDTCIEGTRFVQRTERKMGKLEAGKLCKTLLELDMMVPPMDVQGGRSKSALFDGARLAKQLRELDMEERWRVINSVWVEMLGYAASNCRVNFHAKQLTSGGEFLTHVWFLMAHLGIVDNNRILARQKHAKLVLVKPALERAASIPPNSREGQLPAHPP